MDGTINASSVSVVTMAMMGVSFSTYWILKTVYLIQKMRGKIKDE